MSIKKNLVILFLYFTNTFSFQHQIPSDYMSYNRVRKIIKDIYNTNSKEYNLEHIVPQSFFKGDKKLKSDMHNIILYPEKMNLHRSNFEYISDFKLYPSSKLINNKGEVFDYIEPIQDSNVCIKTSSKRYFLPEKKYRGLISRSCMYVLTTYPKYKDDILNNVINPYTLLTWHHQHPITDFEIYKNNKIYEYQKNKNEFICNPKLLVDVMQDMLDIDLSIFKKFIY